MALNDVLENLINFEVYKEGTSRLIGMAKIKLPELEHLTTTIKGNGIGGEVEVNTRGHYSNLESVITFRVARRDAVQFLREDKSHQFSCYGAYEKYDAATGERSIHQLKIDMRGTAKNLDMGEFEPGETAESELTLTLDYVKFSEDGKEILLIDKFSSISRIDGFDGLEAVRRALGLN